jgi:hypothetical protein
MEPLKPLRVEIGLCPLGKRSLVALPPVPLPPGVNESTGPTNNELVFGTQAPLSPIAIMLPI